MILKQTYDVDEILLRSIPEVEVIEFNQHDFKVLASEESIVIYRTKKENISDPYIFYIQSIARRHVNPDVTNIQNFIDNESHAKPIAKDELLKQIKDLLSELKTPYDFILKGEFVDAVEFEEEWLTKTFLCETTEEVIFFNWMTTA